MTGTVIAGGGVLGPVRAALRETGASLRAVFSNRGLRRLQLALAGSMVGDWAYATAVAVWAFGVGGATAVGVWMAIRLGLMAITSPFTALLADHYSRKLVMIGTDAVRAVLVVAAALCLIADTPAWPVFVLATLTALLGTPFRVAQSAITPQLARTPTELAASNGAASTVESLAFFLGPALGALILTFWSVPAAFFVNAATFCWSMLLIGGLPGAAPAPARVEADPTDEPEAKPGFLSETLAGFKVIRADKDLLVVTAEICVQTIIAGATTVFPLLLAVQVLDIGAEGVGFLDAVFGAGALLGGVVAIGRASRGRAASDLTAGVLLWSAPLLLICLWPHPATVIPALLLLGFGNPLVDVNFTTIVQRITPDEVLGRVFGAMEACLIATMALGAAATPLLVHLVGLRGMLGILGGTVALLALAGMRRMRALDRRLQPAEGLDLLQRTAVFAPLSPEVLEGLATKLVRVEVLAGEVILREGDASDRFFVIEHGRVQVTGPDGRVLREEGPGEFFGEIGLLRDVPRTATITALEDSVLQALDREPFLAALTHSGESRTLAEDVVRRRLAA